MTPTMQFQLGGLILLDGETRKNDLKHEYGHYKQEQSLKELYLPIVACTSLIGKLFVALGIGNYYKFWTEIWADELGGVVR